MKVCADDALSNELIEAGRVDGAGEVHIFFSIAFRLLTPGFATVLILAFVATWNNYFLPLVVLNSSENFPVTVGLSQWYQLDPILAWLRDETNARVELQACDGASYLTLIRFSTLQPRPDGGTLISPLHLDGAEVARVRLTRSVDSLDAAQCNAIMASVTARLEQLLANEPVIGSR